MNVKQNKTINIGEETKNKNIRLNNEIKEVNIVFSTDDLCDKCPNKVSKNKCSSEEKVKLIDEKVINYFDIKEGIQNYKELEDRVYNKNAYMYLYILSDNNIWTHKWKILQL